MTAKYEAFLAKIYGRRPHDQRLGQWAFNCLWESHPEIANSVVRGEYIDPFYLDEKMDNFLAFVEHQMGPTKENNG